MNVEIQTPEIVDILNKILNNLADINNSLKQNKENNKGHKPEYYRVFNEAPKRKSTELEEREIQYEISNQIQENIEKNTQANNQADNQVNNQTNNHMKNEGEIHNKEKLEERRDIGSKTKKGRKVEEMNQMESGCQKMDNPIGLDNCQMGEKSKSYLNQKGKKSKKSSNSMGQALIYGKGDLTLEYVRSRLSNIARRGKGKEISRLLNKYDGIRLTDISPKYYSELLKEAENL